MPSERGRPGCEVPGLRARRKSREGQIASSELSRPSQLTWILPSVGVGLGLGQVASGWLLRPSQLTWMAWMLASVGA